MACESPGRGVLHDGDEEGAAAPSASPRRGPRRVLNGGKRMQTGGCESAPLCAPWFEGLSEPREVCGSGPAVL